jgi:hypothetical protein
MKAKTICPVCKREVIEECEACITRKTLVCDHGTGEMDVVEDVEWEIIKD